VEAAWLQGQQQALDATAARADDESEKTEAGCASHRVVTKTKCQADWHRFEHRLRGTDLPQRTDR